MKKKSIAVLTTVFGLLVLAAGLFLSKATPVHTSAYICIGLGCGLFGHGAGAVLHSRLTARDPQLQKQLDIEQNDERNQAILTRAKAQAYNFMTVVLGALMVTFALMGVEMKAILLLVAADLLITGYFIYRFQQYQKEM